MSERFSVAIFGDGPAGLSCAHNLSKRGFNTIDVYGPERRDKSHRSIYSTDRILDAESTTLIPSEVRKPLSGIRVLTKTSDVRFDNAEGYFMIDYHRLLEKLGDLVEQDASPKVIRYPMSVLNGARVDEEREHVNVWLDCELKEYDYLVDATGVEAKIIKKVDSLRKDENHLAEYLYGGVYDGALERDDMILVIGPSGGTCYVCPSVCPGKVDAVFTAYGYKSNFRQFLSEGKYRLRALVDFIKDKHGIFLQRQFPEDIFSGIIRNQPVNKVLSERVYALGDSAGMAKPGTSQLIDRTIIMSSLLADELSRGNSPQDYLKHWRNQFKFDSFFFAGVLERLKEQRSNDLGGTFDAMAEAVRNKKGLLGFKDLEEFFVDGKINHRFLLWMVSQPMVRSGMFRALMCNIKVKAGILPISGEYSLPPLLTTD